MKACGNELDELGRAETLNYIYTVHMQAKELGYTTFKISTSKLIKSANNIDFIPNSLFSELGGLDRISMDMGTSIDGLLILRNFIKNNNLSSKYDFIFFDSPPSSNVVTQGAFLYSDYYIIPTIMDPLSYKGVSHYIAIIDKIYNLYCEEGDYRDILKDLFGNKPRFIGIFETIKKG